jgi:hypothetical protein
MEVGAMRPQLQLFLFTCLVLLSTLPTFPARAEEEVRDLPLLQGLVESPAETTGYVTGLDPEADSLCYTALPESLMTDSFKKLFRIYASDGVFNGYVGSPGWTEAQWDTFMTAVYDGDSTTTEDVFPLVWNYYCLIDSAAAEDSLAIPGPNGTATHQLEISLYHVWNWCAAVFQGDCDTLGQAPYFCDTSKELESAKFSY